MISGKLGLLFAHAVVFFIRKVSSSRGLRKCDWMRHVWADHETRGGRRAGERFHSLL